MHTISQRFSTKLVEHVRTKCKMSEVLKLSPCFQMHNGDVWKNRYCSNESLKNNLLTDRDLPANANVVVIGGGIVGTSSAYHLAKKGVDVVLLERQK